MKKLPEVAEMSILDEIENAPQGEIDEDFKRFTTGSLATITMQLETLQRTLLRIAMLLEREEADRERRTAPEPEPASRP